MNINVDDVFALNDILVTVLSVSDDCIEITDGKSIFKFPQDASSVHTIEEFLTIFTRVI